MYAATCRSCNVIYVGQMKNSFTGRWNAHRRLCEKATKEYQGDKAALRIHFYCHHNSFLINKLDIAECYKMKKLDLYSNNLGDDGASHISTCLSKIEELDISWCKIRASGIKSISDVISKLPEPAWSSSRNKFRVEQLSAATPPLSPVDDILDLQTSPSHIILQLRVALSE
ncbi:unnamed protein product [Clavelina lepadiformis]|uniref:Uncharacterized protein n=1 Tax=Clavelina lepadiformis TaxID=159417 RepID=A0ABP0GC91_CLALP